VRPSGLGPRGDREALRPRFPMRSERFSCRSRTGSSGMDVRPRRVRGASGARRRPCCRDGRIIGLRPSRSPNSAWSQASGSLQAAISSAASFMCYLPLSRSGSSAEKRAKSPRSASEVHCFAGDIQAARNSGSTPKCPLVVPPRKSFSHRRQSPRSN
jgi:hypothetical protein